MELDPHKVRVGDTLVLQCTVTGVDLSPTAYWPFQVRASPDDNFWCTAPAVAEHIPKPAEPKDQGWAYGGKAVDILAVDDGWAWIKYRDSGNHASVQLISLDRTDG